MEELLEAIRIELKLANYLRIYQMQMAGFLNYSDEEMEELRQGLEELLKYSRGLIK